MKLKTERLKLEELSLGDLDDIHQLHLLPETDEFNTLGIPENIETTKQLVFEWIKQQQNVPRTSYVFSVRLAETNQFIGLLALNLGKTNYKIAETWYKIHSAYWRRGYTTEALLELLNFGFHELGLHRIEAGCAVENIASIRVLEKVGMIKEGSKRKILPIRGKWVDNYIYAILDTEIKDHVEYKRKLF